MGKRKRPRNVVKVDLEDVPKSEKIVPVLVQQKSRDGRRLEQTVHNVPVPPSQPPPSTFNPSPTYGSTEDDVFTELHDPMEEPSGPDRVRLHFSLQRVY